MESKHAARARPSPPVFAGTMKWVTCAEWSALSIVSSPTSNGAMQREPHLVERSNVHRLQHSPAAQRSRRDQKSRNREENLHSPLPIPYERGNNLLRNPVRLQHICRNKPQVDVVHQHEKDGQPAQQIHPIQAFPATSRLHRLTRVHAQFPRFRPREPYPKLRFCR
jgi:hypothetical protein